MRCRNFPHEPMTHVNEPQFCCSLIPDLISKHRNHGSYAEWTRSRCYRTRTKKQSVSMFMPLRHAGSSRFTFTFTFTFTLTLVPLTSPNSRTWRLIRLWVCCILVQVYENPRIVTSATRVSVYTYHTQRSYLLVSTRHRNKRTRYPVSSSGNLDLRASQVELRFIGLHGHVKCNVLYAEQVVARRCCSRNCRVGCNILVYRTW